MEFKTHQEIDEHYRKQGVDVDALQKEFEEVKNLHDKAIKNIRKRKWFFGIFWSPFQGFGRYKPEVYQEIKRIEKNKEDER